MHHPAGQLDLVLRRLQREQRPGMADRQAPLVYRLCDFVGQAEHSQQVGHHRPTFADAGGHLLLGQVKLLHQLAIRQGLFNRGQFLALDVFHQRHLQTLGVADFLDHHRHALQAGALGGTQAALADDELVALVHLAHHQRLQHALVVDRLGQFSEAVFVEDPPRLARVGADLGDRHPPLDGRRQRCPLGNQGAEPPS